MRDCPPLPKLEISHGLKQSLKPSSTRGKQISRIRKTPQCQEPRATWSGDRFLDGSLIISSWEHSHLPSLSPGELHSQYLLRNEVTGNEGPLAFLCPRNFCPISLSCLMSTFEAVDSPPPLIQVLAFPTCTVLWSPVCPPFSDLIYTGCPFPSGCFNCEVGVPQLWKFQLPTRSSGRKPPYR